MCDDCLNNPNEAPDFPGQLYGLRVAEIMTNQSLSHDQQLEALADMTFEFVEGYANGDPQFLFLVLPEIVKFSQFLLAALAYLDLIEANTPLLEQYLEGFTHTHEKWMEAMRLKEQDGPGPSPEQGDDEFWSAA